MRELNLKYRIRRVERQDAYRVWKLRVLELIEIYTALNNLNKALLP